MFNRGFQVPAVLAETDLPMSKVHALIDTGKKIKRIKARLSGLPAKAEKYQTQITDLVNEELELLSQAGLTADQVDAWHARHDKPEATDEASE